MKFIFKKSKKLDLHSEVISEFVTHFSCNFDRKRGQNLLK
jgi:hypothetical protein